MAASGALSPSAQVQSVQAALAALRAFRNSRAMMKSRNILGALCASLLLAPPLRAEPVTIFAAASLKTALDEVIEGQAVDAIAVYGGSAAIARQVAQGAGADIVILAHQDWMDWLGAQGALAPATRCDLLGNTLVLAGAAERGDVQLRSAQDLVSALAGARLAVGHLRSVPAGQYTAAFLAGQGWLDALRPHLAQTSNVRLALALLARGEAPLGFVYASDVAAEPRVRALFSPAPETYPAIRYPMALIAPTSESALRVATALAGARDVFLRNGFAALPQTAPERCK